VAKMSVLHGLMSWPNITTLMIYRNMKCQGAHMKQLQSMEMSCRQMMVWMTDNY
jgi:hypothetical protein